jgi:hypothetical protein
MDLTFLTDEKIAELTERIGDYVRAENKRSSFVGISREEIAERANGWLYLTMTIFTGKSRWGNDYDVYWHPERDELRYRIHAPAPPPVIPEPEPEPSQPVNAPVTQLDISRAYLAGLDEIRSMLPDVTRFTQFPAVLIEHLHNRQEDGTGFAGKVTAMPDQRPERVYVIFYNHNARQHSVVKTSVNPEDRLDELKRERLKETLAKYPNSGHLRRKLQGG